MNRSRYWVKYANGHVEKTYSKLTEEEIKIFGCGITHYQAEKAKYPNTYFADMWVEKKKPEKPKLAIDCVDYELEFDEYLNENFDSARICNQTYMPAYILYYLDRSKYDEELKKYVETKGRKNEN